VNTDDSLTGDGTTGSVLKVDPQTTKNTPIDADSVGLWDSVGLKFVKTTLTNFYNYLKGKFDLVYLAQTTVTQKMYLMRMRLLLLLRERLHSHQKPLDRVFRQGNSRFRYNGSLSNTERIYKMMVDNGMFNYLQFGWAADGGYKPRTSGILTFFTKIYNFFGTNDAAQATALNQPYRFFDGGMKNVGNQFLTMTAETMTATEQWTLTARLRWDGSNNAIAGLFGKGSDTLSIIGLRVGFGEQVQIYK
jgi:hypothetical protein